MEINNYKQISTKRGDSGRSSDYSNKTYSKSDILFNLLGNIDELSSTLGVTYHYTTFKELIMEIQTRLQDINSLIATSDDLKKSLIRGILLSDIQLLEKHEAEILTTTVIKPVFVLPGSDSTLESAYLDLSRSVARRCERSLVDYILTTKREDLNFVLQYLNRLSDLLFIMARNK